MHDYIEIARKKLTQDVSLVAKIDRAGGGGVSVQFGLELPLNAGTTGKPEWTRIHPEEAAILAHMV